MSMFNLLYFSSKKRIERLYTCLHVDMYVTIGKYTCAAMKKYCMHTLHVHMDSIGA